MNRRLCLSLLAVGLVLEVLGASHLVAAEPRKPNVVVKEPRLFQLKEDIGEATDLAAKNPEKVKELLADWKTWNAEQKEPLWKPAVK